jgi:hypothetical protein
MARIEKVEEAEFKRIAMGGRTAETATQLPSLLTQH